MISYVPENAGESDRAGKLYFATTDINGNYTFVNRLFQQRFGAGKDKLIGSPVTSIIYHEDLKQCYEAVNKCLLEPGNSVSIELRKPAKSHGFSWFRWEFTAMVNKQGMPEGVCCVGVDITEGKSMHDALPDLFNADPFPKIIYDASTLQILAVNEAAVLFYGYSRVQFLSLNIYDLHVFGDRTKILKEAQEDQFYKKLRKSISQHEKKNGEIINVESTSVSIEFNGVECRYVSIIDISDRDSSQNVLNENRERYKVYIEQSSEAIWRYELKMPVSIDESPEHVIEHIRKYAYLAECNDIMASMYGFEKPSDLEGSLLEQLMDFHDPNNIAYLRGFIAAGFKILDAESTEKDKFGNTKCFLNNLIGIVEDGLLKRAWGTQRDITNIKKSEIAIKESESRFREVADSAPVMIWMADTANRTTYVNRQWIEFTGINESQFQEIGWREIVHPDDIKYAVEKFDQAFAARESLTLVYRLRMKNSEYRWVLDKSIPRKLEDGTFLGYIGSVSDIHDQKITEEKLRYQVTLLENVSDIIVISDLDFNIRSFNHVAEEFYGITTDEVIGKPFNEVVHFQHQVSRDHTIVMFRKHGIWKGEVSYLNKKGELKYLLITVTYVTDENGIKIGVMSVARDITDRKQADEKLKQSELFYRHLIADSLDGILLVDKDGKLTFASPSVKNILGYEVEEVIGRNAFEFVHQEDIEWAMSSLQKEVKENPEVKFILIRLLKKNKSWLWCVVRGHNLLANPHINSIVIHFHDDTLRKHAGDALKESEQRFRQLIRDLQLGVVVRNNEGRATLCNQAVLDMYGLKEEEFLNKTLQETSIRIISENDVELSFADHPSEVALKTALPVKDCVLGFYNPVRQEWLWMLVNSNPVFDSNNCVTHVVTSFADITERKKLENRLIASQINKQKVITKATLDGQEKERKEIGKELHDNIGQQLTTTKLYLDLAKSTADDPTAEMVNLATKSVLDVINEIRRMSRSLVPPTLGDIGLTEAINDLVDPVRRMRNVTVRFYNHCFSEELLHENLKLTIFRILQEQLNNIVKYADANNIIISVETDEDCVYLEVADDGIGFDMNATKKGLGLKNIVNRAELFNGNAEIITAPDEGCTLRVTIPLLLTQSD